VLALEQARLQRLVGAGERLVPQLLQAVGVHSSNPVYSCLI
jgi:hypothetical protein